jgi:ankyrin repeat protein
VYSASLIDGIIRDGQIELLRIAFTHSKELLPGYACCLFWGAAKYDQVPIMEMLLDLPHFDWEWLNRRVKPTTVMYSIVCQGHTGVLRCLLASDSFEPNMRMGVNKSSLLHLAVMKGQISVADMLLTYETLDVNGKDRQSYTALQRAAQCGSLGVIKSLLRRPDININQNTRRTTALHPAARHNQVAVIELLLRHHDIAVHGKDAEGQTALRTAVSHGASEAVQLLLAQPTHNAGDQDPDDTTLLQLASHRGQLDIVQLLIKHETISLEDPRNSKSSLLRAAVLDLQWPVVEFLVKHTGELSKSACTTTFFPTGENSPGILELLLDSGDFSVAETGRNGQNLLHIAAGKGALDVLTRILALDYIDVNTFDDQGWTALHYGAFTGHLGVVESLLKQANIQVNAREQRQYGQQGVTALTLAKDKGFVPIVNMLGSHRANDTLMGPFSRQDVPFDDQEESGGWYGSKDDADLEHPAESGPEIKEHIRVGGFRETLFPYLASRRR